MSEIMVDDKLLIGRDEWCQFPDLHVPAIKAKIDTGAKTSAIHAFNIKPLTKKNKEYVQFDLHPLQGNNDIIITCTSPVVDQRFVMSSNGHKEHRYVIATVLKIGMQAWSIELTLSNRDPLRYRMLLGREALNRRVLIDPGITCNQNKLRKQTVLDYYSSKKRLC